MRALISLRHSVHLISISAIVEEYVLQASVRLLYVCACESARTIFQNDRVCVFTMKIKYYFLFTHHWVPLQRAYDQSELSRIHSLKYGCYQKTH